MHRAGKSTSKRMDELLDIFVLSWLAGGGGR
jgi:hypothetical protein